MEAKEKILKRSGGFNHGLYGSVPTDVILKITPSSHEKKTEAEDVGRRNHQDNATGVSLSMHGRQATADGVHQDLPLSLQEELKLLGKDSARQPKTSGKKSQNIPYRFLKVLELKNRVDQVKHYMLRYPHSSRSTVFFQTPVHMAQEGSNDCLPCWAAPWNNAGSSGIMGEAIFLLAEETAGNKRAGLEAFNEVRFNNGWRRLFWQVIRRTA